MVYSIDKLDGSIASVAADRVEYKETLDDIVIQFYHSNFNPNAKDSNGHVYADFNDRLVGVYYLSNICGVREVIGITDKDLENMYKEDILGMNENGEYCAPSDGEEYVESIR